MSSERLVTHDNRWIQAMVLRMLALRNRNIVYKGQLAPVQVYQYYHDLVSVDYEGHFALVHSQVLDQHIPLLGSITAACDGLPTTVRSTPSAATRTGCERARAS